jgi:hypothetical protein
VPLRKFQLEFDELGMLLTEMEQCVSAAFLGCIGSKILFKYLAKKFENFDKVAFASAIPANKDI